MARVAHPKAGSLPAEVTSFVGRRQAATDVKYMLSASRLVTLTGPGGVGKTRLARHVGQQLRRSFPDGVWLVELAEVQDPALVSHAMAAALNLPDSLARRPEDALSDYLADRQLLVLLDNCEHVSDSCAQLVSTLLGASPGLRILATSRERLAVAGEHVWPVEPLSVPDLDESSPAGMEQYEALRLFEDRASAALAGFALGPENVAAVARLCRRLDGLPLAIELAAARMRILSVEQILARLDDRYSLLTAGNRDALPRQQTLLGAMEWSFNLCSKLEQTLWPKLSVFAGEFDLDAAESVCAGDGLSPQDVFTALAGLMDKSILYRGDGRVHASYQMLETIRQYGRDRLADDGSLATLRRRHRDYYLRLAERGEAAWFGPDQVAWLHRLRAEQANVWAALEFCLSEPGEARTGQRMVAALGWYWTARAVRAGRHWMDQALAAETSPSCERAKALWVDGWVAITQGDIAHAMSLLEESRDVAEVVGDEAATAYATQFLGRVKTFQNLPSEALPLLEQALRRHRVTGERNVVTTLALYHVATAASLLGDGPRAIALCEECVRTCNACGECWTRSWALWHLGFAWWQQGKPDFAISHAKEALRLKRVLNDRAGVALCIELLACVARTGGDADHAARLHDLSTQMWEPIGGTPLLSSGWGMLLSHGLLGTALVTDSREERGHGARTRKGPQLTLEEAVAYALAEQTSLPDHDPAVSLAPLTGRQQEVAKLVADGKSNKEIAASLVISPRTAETHVDNILNKLGFTTRSQIAAWITARQEK